MPTSSKTTGGYDPAYGGIPQLPMPTTTAPQAVMGDLANLGNILNLTGRIGTAEQNQLLSQYNMAIPNYSALTATASGNVADELRGGVPQDVINLLAQQGAERGITSGMPGSPNSNAAFLRALGLTSLGQEQQGFQNLATMTQTAPVAPLFNPASFLVTPEQQQSAAAAQSIYNAAPIPAAAAAKAMQTDGAVGGSSGVPWWAQSSAIPGLGWGGPGTIQTGPGTYHTPNMQMTF